MEPKLLPPPPFTDKSYSSPFLLENLHTPLPSSTKVNSPDFSRPPQIKNKHSLSTLSGRQHRHTKGYYESLEGSFSYEFAYEFAYPIPPIGHPIGYVVDMKYEIIYFNRKLDMLLDMEMTLPGFRRIYIPSPPCTYTCTM